VKLVSYRHDGRASFGAVVADRIAPLADAEAPTLRAALSTGGVDGLARRLENAVPGPALADVELLPPVPDPDKILCVGVNYKEHAAEAGLSAPSRPAFFVRFPGSLVGSGQPVVAPSVSEQFDYEGELAVVIGRPVFRAGPRDAASAIAGYTCFADNAVRDWQKHTTQATAGKNFRRSGACGPWLTTADEVADPTALSVVTRHNGEEVQRGTVADFCFGLDELISYVSTWAELLPGDVIATGTPAGVGLFRCPPRWLRPGDRLEVEIAGVGLLANDVTEDDR
jgi:2-keto-4-pentenoate hydratase/2-oxohepta-3-ene-1,7-dioic acid hydratase in catechol pathway